MTKGPDAFRTISEAADEVGVAQHVLRFWETKFNFIKPMKRAGGRRFYRPRDVAVLSTLHRLLHTDGLSIAQVQKLHRDGGLKASAPPAPVAASRSRAIDDAGRSRLRAVLSDLLVAKSQLDRLLPAR